MAILNSVTPSNGGNTDDIVAAFKQFCIESYVVNNFRIPNGDYVQYVKQYSGNFARLKIIKLDGSIFGTYTTNRDNDYFNLSMTNNELDVPPINFSSNTAETAIYKNGNAYIYAKTVDSELYIRLRIVGGERTLTLTSGPTLYFEASMAI